MKRRTLLTSIGIIAIAAILGVAAVAILYERSQATIRSMQRSVVAIDTEPPVTSTADVSNAFPTALSVDNGLVVRCAVINGMNITGFWKAVTDRFTRETGIRVQTVTFGEKAVIDASFREGGVDLLTMHSCDKIINLVADGLAIDPQPWARNDLVIVGPPTDPAGIRGLTDAAEAFGRISRARAPLVVHASIGAQEVLRSIVGPAGLQFDPASVTMLLDDSNREVLKIAADKGAYTLVGRIPFRIGRLPNAGLELMVQGDPRLRRPYVVVVADPGNVKGARVEPARKLAEYLTSPETQRWIEGWGKGILDDRPVFFPVSPR